MLQPRRAGDAGYDGYVEIALSFRRAKEAVGFARRNMDLSVQCSARNMQQAADGRASGERQRILGLLAALAVTLPSGVGIGTTCPCTRPNFLPGERRTRML
jgi:hypothetical protein